MTGRQLHRTDDLDPVEFAGDDGVLCAREGLVIAGRGALRALPLTLTDPHAAAVAVNAALTEIQVEGTSSLNGAVAVGALPFAPDGSGHLVVPDEVLVTPGPLVGGIDAPPASADVRDLEDPDKWCLAVDDARRSLGGDLRKVVLGRSLLVESAAPIDVRALLRRLAHDHPSSMVFSIEGFVGASPELLVARRDDEVRSHPLAGTTPRGSDPGTDAELAAKLLSSTKDREEHRITIDMVYDTLLDWCSYLDWEAEPSLLRTANVQHLGTSVSGRLSSPPASVVELMAALHPTPAVGGHPRDRALERIRELEPNDRGRFAGPVGWVDAAGNGEWYVGIRSAEIDGSDARLWAGVGVVADSDAAAELAETRAKFRAMLGGLGVER